MASLISTLARAAFGSQPELRCDANTWSAGIDELRRRSEGIRETGAFLLGRKAKAAAMAVTRAIALASGCP